jgi:cyclic beta-1,2-glucan synthetase
MAMAPERRREAVSSSADEPGDHARVLTLTGYAEWTLGVLREKTRPHICTSVHPERSAMLAQNGFDPDFAGHIAFCAMSEDPFPTLQPIGAHLSVEMVPSPIRGDFGHKALGKATAAHDPCAALQCVVELAPGETREIVFILGAALGADEANRLIDEYRDVQRAQDAVSRSCEDWSRRLSVVRVKTPEPTFDTMINHWSLYQALSCRMWARSAVYQSGGAFGFRDQLQDVLAFVYSEPVSRARAHPSGSVPPVSGR